MSDADHDPVLQRAIDELRQLPPLDREAVSRVVGAAAAARLSPADEPVFVERAARGRSIRVWSAIGMAAAAAVVGFVARGQWRTSDEGTPVAASWPLLQSRRRRRSKPRRRAIVESKPILQQFVFDNARRKARVGRRGFQYLESKQRGHDAVVKRGAVVGDHPDFPWASHLRIHGGRFAVHARSARAEGARR